MFECFDSADNVGFFWDCGHEKCFTPGKGFMQFFGHRLICTHIHDNFGIYNQDSHLLPFDGIIDFNCFAQHIQKFDFNGTLMLEVFASKSDKYIDVSVEEYLERAAISAKRLLDIVDNSK